MSAWDAIPGGAAFGTLVHSVLEQLDDPADDAAVRAVVAAQVARFAPGLDASALTAGLLAALATPLGDAGRRGCADRRTGRAIGCRSWTSSCRWPAATSRARPRVVLADLVPLWREHVPTGLLSSYADALAELPDVPLRGYLTGSIDAVLRVGSPADPRYLVVDYKTNRLGGYDEPLTAWHYRSAALETAMVEAHYPLQALLYAVALHRYLRWRQPAYDPDVHLGGVLYLFLRGMSRAGRARRHGAAPGVFCWRPPTGLVVGLSDLLAGSA